MSLTSELNTARTPINLFFKERFPGLTEFTKMEGPTIKAMRMLIPPINRGNVRLVGSAFDYRLRMHLKSGEIPGGPILQGLQRMKSFGSGNADLQDAGWAVATEILLDELSEGGEEELVKKSVLLAYLDAGFRSGGKWPGPLTSLAESIEIGETLTKKNNLACIPDELADEVRTLMKGAEPEFPLSEGETVLGNYLKRALFWRHALVEGARPLDSRESGNPVALPRPRMKMKMGIRQPVEGR